MLLPLWPFAKARLKPRHNDLFSYHSVPLGFGISQCQWIVNVDLQAATQGSNLPWVGRTTKAEM